MNFGEWSLGLLAATLAAAAAAVQGNPVLSVNDVIGSAAINVVLLATYIAGVVVLYGLR